MQAIAGPYVILNSKSFQSQRNILGAVRFDEVDPFWNPTSTAQQGVWKKMNEHIKIKVDEYISTCEKNSRIIYYRALTITQKLKNKNKTQRLTKVCDEKLQNVVNDVNTITRKFPGPLCYRSVFYPLWCNKSSIFLAYSRTIFFAQTA